MPQKAGKLDDRVFFSENRTNHLEVPVFESIKSQVLVQYTVHLAHVAEIKSSKTTIKHLTTFSDHRINGIWKISVISPGSYLYIDRVTGYRLDKKSFALYYHSPYNTSLPLSPREHLLLLAFFARKLIGTRQLFVESFLTLNRTVFARFLAPNLR